MDDLWTCLQQNDDDYFVGEEHYLVEEKNEYHAILDHLQMAQFP